MSVCVCKFYVRFFVCVHVYVCVGFVLVSMSVSVFLFVSMLVCV